MPQMDGDKSAKMLRENSRLGGLAIVLISSSEPAKLQEIAERVKADAIVCKADARTSLVSTVRAALRSRSRLKLQ
jgi:CheY-like chemotaxis protein